ncbi:hypothetical protein L2E82_29957 [Cichorium intybus]|uniref:Uncharacterized protein n=1 Tax=Cichorium intybus TaxID=13427 RepID=A0ACB9CZF8_CICIN|nr:hypothetical protein L2E82_29957 [Cichorium intybus]
MMTTPSSSTHPIDEDLSNYVLLLEDNMELAERTLKRISNSVNRVIQKAEKEQDKNLLKFLEKSIGFEGVENFDIHQVRPILSIEVPNIWSLPIITLTCIAIALPNIGKEETTNLFKCVGEDILVACFTNIPRVITMKCHESAIEKREASVEAAAKLLGRTTEIIKRLEFNDLPSIDRDKMAFIDEWRLHLQCIP